MIFEKVGKKFQEQYDELDNLTWQDELVKNWVLNDLYSSTYMSKRTYLGIEIVELFPGVLPVYVKLVLSVVRAGQV